jgi:hypothetical protein
LETVFMAVLLSRSVASSGRSGAALLMSVLRGAA